MTKNKKKVITIAVPIDLDDAYLEKIKLMLENYKSVENVVEKASNRLHQNETFETEKDLRLFMAQAGYDDYKIPKHDMGIYYDEGMTIKKIEAGFQVKITA
jgi:hypothetical protein